MIAYRDACQAGIALFCAHADTNGDETKCPCNVPGALFGDRGVDPGVCAWCGVEYEEQP